MTGLLAIPCKIDVMWMPQDLAGAHFNWLVQERRNSIANKRINLNVSMDK